MAASNIFLNKLRRVLIKKCDAYLGRLRSIERTLEAMSLRPFELHLELTNLCNADCIFCPYQFQTRAIEFMTDKVFEKATADFVSIGGGSVGLTPIVGDALIDPKFLERVRFLRAQPQIDRIFLTTNGILLDKHGISEVLNSGLTSITISTAGFEQEMYERVFRSKSYERMRQNVFELIKQNVKLANPLNITIALRTDRPLSDVMKDADFQPILKYKPAIDFTWSFTSANKRITRSLLPPTMKLRVVRRRKESCVELYNGPIVLPNGVVMACSCVASMDAIKDLAIGDVNELSLLDIWTGEKLAKLRASFFNGTLNPTCAGCDMYRDLEFYRSTQGRNRANLNSLRHNGKVIANPKKANSPFSGG